MDPSSLFDIDDGYWNDEPSHWQISIFISFCIFEFIIFVILMTFIIKRRNFQPLKKKSPRLVLASVIGHFLVFFNITIMGSFFELVW